MFLKIYFKNGSCATATDVSRSGFKQKILWDFKEKKLENK